MDVSDSCIAVVLWLYVIEVEGINVHNIYLLVDQAVGIQFECPYELLKFNATCKYNVCAILCKYFYLLHTSCYTGVTVMEICSVWEYIYIYISVACVLP